MKEQMDTIATLQTTLKYTYGIVPIVAGADKFTNLLTDWSQYLHPGIINMVPFQASVFMMNIGIIEIVAGILVLTKTRLGAYIVSIWLILIALTLIVQGKYLDVAVRDLVMSLGAFTLGRLTEIKTTPTNTSI